CSPRWLRRDGSSRHGGRTTTPCVRTAVLAGWHPPSLRTAPARGIWTPKLSYQRPENGEHVTSNPSRYGVTQDGDVLSGTIEANILTDDPDVVNGTIGLFQQLWDDRIETTPVSRRMIEQEIRRRELDPPVLPAKALTARSLLSACREAPDLFAGVYVVAYNSDLGDGGKAALKQLQAQAAPSDEDLGVADFRNAWGYQFENAPPAGTWLVDLSCKGRVPRVFGASRVPDPALQLRVLNENDVTPTIRGIVKVAGATGVFRMSAQDKADLASVATRLLRDSNEFMPLPRVVAMIDRAKR
ncbi:hypothetical protein C8J41_1271, partial [Sphingomonas sp. PP-CC-3G-468]